MQERGLESDASRWALVEIENLYDPGNDFDPIYRVIFGVNSGDNWSVLSAVAGLELNQIGSWWEVPSRVGDPVAQKTRMGVVGKNEIWIVEWNARGL
jgi:hypothetical protein